jgi:hypothetical protein
MKQEILDFINQILNNIIGLKLPLKTDQLSSLNKFILIKILIKSKNNILIQFF